MAAVLHFNPTLQAGGLVLARTTVNTQLTGLIDVSIDYVCRAQDIPSQVLKFFIDAPPPIFPSKTIPRAALAGGQLFMANYSVTQEYGVGTISARYAGVTSKPVRPFKTFEYSSFAAAARVYVALSGAFGSRDFIGAAEPFNDFGSIGPGALTVGMKGRVEAVKYTWATLDTGSALPATVPPQPAREDAFAELDLIPNAVSVIEREGRFGELFQSSIVQTVIDGVPTEGPSYEPPLVSAVEVADFAAQRFGLTGWQDFRQLTPDDWRSRGVVPEVFYSIGRRTEAITPSVYVREIVYQPFVR
jgi:hypothetical protein